MARPCDPVAREAMREVIRQRGPRRIVDAVEYATLDVVGSFNQRRILVRLGYVPPVQFEAY